MVCRGCRDQEGWHRAKCRVCGQDHYVFFADIDDIPKYVCPVCKKKEQKVEDGPLK